ncbi:MAG: penicillin-binding protein 1C, partial [Synergistales bacterium]|nr:penicillin-binding protein 1C [Synergistales bacterium]
GTTIHTTLDRSLQRRLDGLLETALEPYPPSVTAAGIVVEHASGAVRAYVGNARWGSGLPGSWVDCGVAPRSPGSALKPFAYGLAYQRGLLTPSSLVADTPLGFPGAPPENFDRAFRGPMSAGEALATSRNMPAIRVLRMAGYGPFLGFLRRAGFRHIGEDPGHYGDGLVLGGVEVTLLEMARAYASIARRGGLSSLRWTGGEAAPEIPLWNPGAAYLLLRSLAGTEHLPPGVRQSAANAGAPALKTGTSSGFRDAWAAACSKRYTVVLWFGDPEGDTVARLVGSRTAVPAAFRLLQALEARSPCGDPPPCVVRREVCALSGAPPGRACPVTREGLSIRGISPVEHCGLHVVRDGRVVVDVPADLEGYLAGGDRGGRPARRLRILSPVAGETLILPEGRDALSVPLRAQGAGKRYWFVDGRLAAVQQAGDGAVFVTLGPGRHRIGVGTEAGAADGLSVEVATEQGSPPEVIE